MMGLHIPRSEHIFARHYQPLLVTFCQLILVNGLCFATMFSFINHANAATSNIAEQWHGFYYYAKKSVPFDMQIQVTNGIVSGRTSEEEAKAKAAANQVTLGGAASYMYANIAGNIQGTSISFTKTYDGTGGWSHSIKYQGNISADGRAIKGTWRVGFGSGLFTAEAVSAVQSSDTPSLGTSKTNDMATTDCKLATSSKSYGDCIGEYEGVIAKSNGDCTGTFLNKCADWQKYAEYQCVSYIQLFYKQKYPTVLKTEGRWNSAQTFWNRQSYSKLVRHRIGEATLLPKPGDMLFFDTGHPEGHVAIVTGVSDSQISLIQQNIKRDTAYATINYKQLNGVIVVDNGMQFPDGSVTRNKMSLLGWLSPDLGSKFPKDEKNAVLNQLEVSDNHPVFYVDKGACPFECCTYRDWGAEKTTKLYAEPKISSPVVGVIEKGLIVKAKTGEVHTKPGKIIVTRDGATFKIGDVLWVYTYLGEGFFKIWYRGKFITDFLSDGWDNFEFKPKSVWWVNIRKPNGLEGWSNQPENFSNQDACG